MIAAIFLCPPEPGPGIHFVAPACAALLAIDPLHAAAWLIVAVGVVLLGQCAALWLIRLIAREEE